MRVFGTLIALILVVVGADAQLKAPPDLSSCVKFADLKVLEEMASECQHLAVTSKHQKASWEAYVNCPGDPTAYNSEKYMAWRRSNNAQKNKLCSDAVEAAKKDAGTPDAFIVYKPN